MFSAVTRYPLSHRNKVGNLYDVLDRGNVGGISLCSLARFAFESRFMAKLDIVAATD